MSDNDLICQTLSKSPSIIACLTFPNNTGADVSDKPGTRCLYLLTSEEIANLSLFVIVSSNSEIESSPSLAFSKLRSKSSAKQTEGNKTKKENKNLRWIDNRIDR